MNNFKYIHKAHDGKSTVISGNFLARCIANRTIGMVGIGEDSTMFQFWLSDGAQFRIEIKPNAPEIHYSPPTR